MRISILFAGLAGLFVSALATDTREYQHFDCGVNITHASSHFNATIHALHEGVHHHVGSASHKASTHARAVAPIIVNTAFHVVTKAASAGTITPAMVTAQINALNTAYNPYNVQFVLVNTTYTANDAWAVGEGADGDAMKAALRHGTYSTLNIYFQTDLYGSILGTCTLPTDIGPGTPAPSVYVSDGCNVQANTMPAGLVQGYNLGKTAVHETGHWMGLLHTFEGYACTGSGDFIADTPMESVSTDGCPVKPAKDSCPGVAGVDPVHNFMDYSTDACYESFTPLQKARMADMWATYRVGR